MSAKIKHFQISIAQNTDSVFYYDIAPNFA